MRYPRRAKSVADAEGVRRNIEAVQAEGVATGALIDVSPPETEILECSDPGNKYTYACRSFDAATLRQSRRRASPAARSSL